MADGQSYFLLLLLSSILVNWVFPYPMLVSAPVTYIGIVFVIFGISVCYWVRSLFLRNRTTLSPFETPSVLVTTGPFQFSRNPVYLGMTSILLGTALFMGSGIPFISPLLFIAIIEIMFIPIEEQRLERVFGDQYREYKRTVRTWI
ncbi:isoprenylcysteine carboxylmethyltransferase family protein [uncultured Methanospirillum sp.]|uniref:methyltransferase family protein n=1 Tax=uncultured Methanospirillum sp. TaxID=262503 RepID=UPI0029C769BE|nr:isoprenylcysteine carboxylmethyltransferase family protein [uncultured Methanospirillum sp.]